MLCSWIQAVTVSLTLNCVSQKVRLQSSLKFIYFVTQQDHAYKYWQICPGALSSKTTTVCLASARTLMLDIFVDIFKVLFLKLYIMVISVSLAHSYQFE